MPKIFRNVRKQLAAENSVAKYLRYAVGEILLVVIGILIALQVNNWNQQRKDRNLEKQYLQDLLQDLRTDSLALQREQKLSDRQVHAKQAIMAYYNGHNYPNDSLIDFFFMQVDVRLHFDPVTTTLDEMKSTGNIGVIRNVALRRQILKTYHEYANFKDEDEGLYEQLSSESANLYYSSIPNIVFPNTPEEYRFKKPDLKKALRNFKVKNRIMGNYALGMNQAIRSVQKINQDMIKTIRKSLNQNNK
jgi:hypothetical protein